MPQKIAHSLSHQKIMVCQLRMCHPKGPWFELFLAGMNSPAAHEHVYFPSVFQWNIYLCKISSVGMHPDLPHSSPPTFPLRHIRVCGCVFAYCHGYLINSVKSSFLKCLEFRCLMLASSSDYRDPI